MIFLRVFLFLFLCLGADLHAADTPAEPAVELKAVRARPSDLQFRISFLAESEEVTGIKVTGVFAGSKAEKLGIRVGDALTLLNGEPVVGKKKSDLINSEGGLAIRGLMTFTGTRGLFLKKWTLTVDGAELRRKPPLPKPTEAAPPPDQPANPAAGASREP